MTDHRTVEIAGVSYEYGKLDARKQFHVARRLAPLMAELAKVALKEEPEEGKEISDEASMGFFAALTEGLVALKEEDCDYIIDVCLKVCKRKHKQAWSAVMTSDGHLMFTDMELDALLGLSSRVIMDSLGSFFTGKGLSSLAARVVPSE